MKVSPVQKAVVGGLLAGLTALGTAMADGTVAGYEWVGVAVAIVAAGYGVWRVPNKPEDVAEG